jgi:hypothetical protein
MKVGPLTAEQKAMIATAEKLHVWIYALVDRLAKGDEMLTPDEAVFVQDGKAAIRIELTDSSRAVIDKLTAVGFEMIGEKVKTEVTGLIAIEKLAALAEITEVKLITPKF